MKKKKIVIFTARSDFGIMKKTIIKLNNDKNINFNTNWFCIIQNHLELTIEEIDKIKLNKKLRLNFSYSSNSNIKDILNNFSKTMLMAQDF